MSNKSASTHAEHLDAEFQKTTVGYRENLEREINSNAAFIAKLKRQKSSQTPALTESSLPNNESLMSSTVNKL